MAEDEEAAELNAILLVRCFTCKAPQRLVQDLPLAPVPSRHHGGLLVPKLHCFHLQLVLQGFQVQVTKCMSVLPMGEQPIENTAMLTVVLSAPAAAAAASAASCDGGSG